jgi:hypothetical protein
VAGTLLLGSCRWLLLLGSSFWSLSSKEEGGSSLQWPLLTWFTPSSCVAWGWTPGSRVGLLRSELRKEDFLLADAE